jgi:hypothetical protein
MIDSLKYVTQTSVIFSFNDRELMI